MTPDTDDTDDTVAEKPASPRWLRVTGIVAVVVAFAFALWVRFYRIGEPLGGYHVFNEGFYITLAKTLSARSVGGWIANPIDRDNPPLYLFMVASLFHFFGAQAVLARLVSAVSGVVAVAATYLLGERLYGRRLGLLAALALALTPGAVLVSRNAQVDALMVALATTSALAYVVAWRSKRARWAVLGGALLGLALLTKLPAALVVVPLAVLEIAETRGFAWLRERRVWAFAVSALALPAMWFLARLGLDRGQFVSSQKYLLGIARVSGGAVLKLVMFTEPVWLLAPVGIAVMLAGIVVMLVRRTPADAFVLAGLLTWTVFVFLYHYHTYYWLPVTPFAALAIGRALDALGDVNRAAMVAATVALMCAMALFSAVMMSGQKWGAWSPVGLSARLHLAPGKTILAVPDEVMGNMYGPSLRFYNPNVRLLLAGQAPPAGFRGRILELTFPRSDATSAPIGQSMAERIAPVLFGVAISQEPPNTNFFENGPWRLTRVGPPWLFGLHSEKVPAHLVLYDISSELGVK